MELISKANGGYIKPHEGYKGNWIGGYWDVNLSSQFSDLIREAGKSCNRYASDVLIGIDSVKDWLRIPDSCEGKPVVRREYFGFRDMGVDHDTFIKCRLEKANVREVYSAVYLMQAVFNDGYLSVTLYDVTEDFAERGTEFMD